MTPIGTINPLSASPLTRLEPSMSPSEISSPGLLGGAASTTSTTAPTDSFGAMLDGLVGGVAAKQSAAAAQTNAVLMGDTGQLHQSVIAMQESQVAFSLMVEVRNKLVESYQELMRMQV
ncbi:MAG TPA: flagellar hook-basal body complex protein FliE [Opitutaceae bacterium]|jgi:flagellar hook-basal body complex protein FliE|nr:flagellar hook-basal body complex protein FliE [Opitutaceae bacterium]